MRWSRDLRDVDAHASLWVLIPRLVASLTVSSAIILFAFYFTFGELPVFPFAGVIFLDVMVTLVIIGDRFAAQKSRKLIREQSLGYLIRSEVFGYSHVFSRRYQVGALQT